MSDVAVGSHWHYQIMYHKYENPTEFTGEGYYAIHEMYPSLDLWTEETCRCNRVQCRRCKITEVLAADVERH
jgi:hypothetical protein